MVKDSQKKLRESIKTKLFLILAPGLFIVANIFIFGPATIYSGNTSEFGIDFIDLLANYILPIITSMLIVLGVGTFLSKKYLRLYISELFTIGLLLWIQGNFLVWNYGVFDGHGIEWSRYNWQGWIDAGLWIILLIAAFMLFIKIPRICSFVSLVFILLQSVLLISTYLYAPQTFSTKFPIKHEFPKDLFNYSSSFNIIHFLFDGFQTEVLEEIVNENKMGSALDGFVLFRENMTVSGSTLLSLGAVFSGEEYPCNVEYSTFYKEAFSKKGFQNILFNNGYDVNLVPGIKMPTKNFTSYYRVPTIYGGTIKENVISEAALLIDLTLFRHLPHYLKKVVYNDQNWRIQPLFASNKKLGYFHQIDFFKDYIEKLQVKSPRPAYHFMHIVQPHPPFVTAENCDCVTKGLPQNRDSYKIQAKCNIKLFIQFLEKLKGLGIYDSSLIILQADHGIEFAVDMKDNPPPGSEYLNEKTTSIVGRALALLTIKPPHNKGAMTTSNVYTSTLDIAPTIMEIAGLPNHFKGISVFAIDPTEERERLLDNRFKVNGSAYYYRSWDKASKPIQLNIETYQWGSTIDFTFLGNAQPYQAGGWSHPGEIDCWTVGKKATLIIPITRPESSISLKANLRAFLCPSKKLDKQTVDILVNGKKACEWIITKPGFQERKLILPKSLFIDPDRVVLTFNLPDAVSPDQLEISKDPRPLGIGMRTLVLNEFAPYQWGSTIKFGLLGNSQPYEIEGWSLPYEGLTWTVGKKATLIMPISALKSSISLKATLTPLLMPGKLEKQTVDILINGKKAGEWLITEPGFQERTINIPKSLFTDQDRVVLTFNLPDATSPKQLGISNDGRVLGVAMHTIELTIMNNSSKLSGGFYEK